MHHIFKVIYQVLLPFIVPAENLLKICMASLKTARQKPSGYLL
jgi:hypothetical protein